MFERSENVQKKRNPLDISLRAGVLAASLFAPLGQDKVEAAEIPKTATWEQGVDTLRNKVASASVEHMATYVIEKSESSFWLPTIAGTELDVDAGHPRKIAEQAMREQENDAESIELICEIHTHPARSIEKEFGVQNGSDSLAPPSFGDTFVVSLGGRPDKIRETIENAGGNVEHVASAVLDPKGVWYYRRLTEAEQQELPESGKTFNEKVDDFERQQRDFVSASSIPGQFNFDVSYEQLRSAYESITTKVRFVPYEELQNEPPCAGPDYVPENSK